MTAAVIAATYVAKQEIPTNIVSGTLKRRRMKLYLEGPKAAQNDWFLLTTYLTAAEAASISSVLATSDAQTAGANIPLIDTYTYTSADNKLIVTSANVGNESVTIEYFTG